MIIFVVYKKLNYMTTIQEVNEIFQKSLSTPITLEQAQENIELATKATTLKEQFELINQVFNYQGDVLKLSSKLRKFGPILDLIKALNTKNVVKTLEEVPGQTLISQPSRLNPKLEKIFNNALTFSNEQYDKTTL
jgi:hypothetical protein